MPNSEHSHFGTCHDSGLHKCTISSYFVQAVRTESRSKRQFGSNRGFSRDVTRSRECLVTLLIRHFGGQASAAVCAVCALQCVVYNAFQPSLWRCVSVDVIKRHDFQTRLP